jgi:hypothetical protein
MNDASEGLFDVLSDSPENVNLIKNCSSYNDVIILLIFDNIFIHQKLKIH